MVIREKDALKIVGENPRGGKGTIYNYRYLDKDEINTPLKGFYVNELLPGSEICYHEHIDDEEFYYILSGKGIVNDNGKEREIGPGDLIYTPFKEGHGLKNTGDEPIKFAAFIVEG
ncbi:cupin domain-containing protein [Ilyobacter sp.]|uniref:cupin domain-containing protein n=1 Tax=Ilyobacter sp. TaxID=3100343 RepID=UPI003567E588